MYRESQKHLPGVLFYISLSCYLVGSFLEYTIWMAYMQDFINVIKIGAYITLISCIVDGFRWCLNNFNKAYIPYLIIILLMFIYAVIFKVNSGFVCFGYSFAAIRLNKKQLLRIVKSIMLFLFILGIVGGIFNGNIESREFGNTKERYSFGFNDSYSLQMLWMSIVSCYILIQRKTTFIQTVLLLAFSVLLNLFGDTRTAFIATVFLLIANLIMQNYPITFRSQNNKRKHLLLRWIFLICFAFINILCWVNYRYFSKLALVLDGLFTGRISMTTRYISFVCGGEIPLLPIQNVDFDLSIAALNSLSLDSSYAQMLYGYGIIFSVLVLILFNKAMKSAIERDDVRIIVVLAAVAINGMLQPTVLAILYNPAILLSFDLIFKNMKTGRVQNGK